MIVCSATLHSFDVKKLAVREVEYSVVLHTSPISHGNIFIAGGKVCFPSLVYTIIGERCNVIFSFIQ